jgi:hypothetical protein
VSGDSIAELNKAVKAIPPSVKLYLDTYLDRLQKKIDLRIQEAVNTVGVQQKLFFSASLLNRPRTILDP